jgi:hypothetical protein
MPRLAKYLGSPVRAATVESIFLRVDPADTREDQEQAERDYSR